MGLTCIQWNIIRDNRLPLHPWLLSSWGWEDGPFFPVLPWLLPSFSFRISVLSLGSFLSFSSPFSSSFSSFSFSPFFSSSWSITSGDVFPCLFSSSFLSSLEIYNAVCNLLLAFGIHILDLFSDLDLVRDSLKFDQFNNVWPLRYF